MSSHGVVQPGDRRTGFIRADTGSCSCSISSRQTKGATSTFLRVQLPSLNPRFTDACKRKGPPRESFHEQHTLERLTDVGMYALARESRHRSIELQLRVSRRPHSDQDPYCRPHQL